MNEQRRGEQWHPGNRIRYVHPGRSQLVEGEIKERSWGRDRGKPIYLFTVVADGEEDSYVIGPERVQPVTDEPLPQVTPAPLRVGPKPTTFSPQVSDDRDEERKEARKRAAQSKESPEDAEDQAPPTA
ncbi:hypothetical protein [Arthrobacter sp. NPDC092385]|uniref:hypothetical protein n=1 Tax=Arthrobacter sp. NPDC092385 TaxID=3363943 RepID=UPI003828763F